MTVVASLGVPLAVGNALGTRKVTPSSALGTVLRFCGLIAVPAIVASVLILRGPLNNIHGSSRLGAGVLLGCIPFAVLAYCLTYFFIAEGALGPVAITQAVQPAVTTVAAVVLFSLHRLTVATYLVALIVAAVLGPIVALRLLRVGPRRGAPLLPLVRFGVRGYAGTLASFVAVRADQAVIGPLLGSSKLGVYAISATIAALPTSFALAVAHRSFGDVAAAPESEQAEVIGAFLRLGLLVATLVAAGITVASPFLLSTLYGSGFASALIPLLLLLPGSIALAGSGGAASSLTAIGRPGRVTLAELTGFGVSVVGLPIVVPRFGIIGAAVLSTVAYAATFAMYLRFLPELPIRSIVPGRAEVLRVTRSVRAVLRRRSPSTAPLDDPDAQGTTAIRPE